MVRCYCLVCAILDTPSESTPTIARAKYPRPQPPKPTEADLQAELDVARARLRELVVFGMKAWLPAPTLHRLRDAEQWRRREIKMHFRMLERLREEQRRRPTGPTRAAVDEAGSLR
jgi:hypothetical protein